jgi:hypothetical protein
MHKTRFIQVLHNKTAECNKMQSNAMYYNT